MKLSRLLFLLLFPLSIAALAQNQYQIIEKITISGDKNDKQFMNLKNYWPVITTNGGQCSGLKFNVPSETPSTITFTVDSYSYNCNATLTFNSGTGTDTWCVIAANVKMPQGCSRPTFRCSELMYSVKQIGPCNYSVVLYSGGNF